MCLVGDREGVDKNSLGKGSATFHATVGSLIAAIVIWTLKERSDMKSSEVRKFMTSKLP